MHSENDTKQRRASGFQGQESTMDKRDLYRTCRIRDDAPIPQAGQFAGIIRRIGDCYTVRATDGTVQALLPVAYLERFVL